MNSRVRRNYINWSFWGFVEPHTFGVVHLQVAFKFRKKTELATLTFDVLGGIVPRAFHFLSRSLKWVYQLLYLLSDSEGRRLATFRMYGLNVL